MTEQHDWRLAMASEPELYAKYTWRFKKWTQTRDHWDHDHCEFCNTEISAVVNDKILNDGWTNEDEYYWICSRCFNDFKNVFNFKVKSA
jgi:hypothetical protein